jgi:uncharacterized protein YjiS (DUF1127 family)
MSQAVVYYLFTISNVLRLVSYVPQIHKIARDTHGASAISYSTWILWLVANGTTAVYSISTLGDATMAWVNGLNALCCVIVIILTAFKRRQFEELWRRDRGYRSVINHHGSGMTLTQITEALHVWRERVRSRRELAQLSDRDLRDMSICRSDIIHEAEKPFWRA